MSLLDLIIKEYLGIVAVLEQNYSVSNERLIIDRDIFKGMLEKYAYIPFTEKTKAYKALNFIIHDNSNYTMPYKDPELKKTVRKVIINYATYKTVKLLYETTANL